MKISLNWLTDYVDVSSYAAGELGEVFTRIGLCCESIEEIENDIVFDLEITSNRPDCLGHIGVAREIAATLSLELKLPDLDAIVSAGAPVADLTSVEVECPDLCPRYTARVIRGVRIAPSPGWMVERLEAVGLRSINNIVDITNYVLMEYAQPLHAFDFNRLAGKRIIVRRARDGEQIVSIDGTQCTLTEDMVIIADAERPVAVAGVMGGIDTEVSDETTDVLIESAQFSPAAIRKMARMLSLMSESSYRFERGVDPLGVERASLRACGLILQLAGGQLANGVIDVWAEQYEPVEVSMRPARCRKLLGMDIPDHQQVEVLDRLGLSPRVRDEKIICSIPSWRRDLSREIDLIEEVARLVGYDKIPVGNEVVHPVLGIERDEWLRRQVYDVLRAGGFDEAITYGFIDDSEAALFGFRSGMHVDRRLRRTNNMLRPTLICSLLRACKINQDAGNPDVNLYELAAVFPPSGDEMELPDEHTRLAMVSSEDISRVRGIVDVVIGQVAFSSKVEVEPADVPGFSPGQAGRILLNGRDIGFIGSVASNVLDYYGLERPFAAASIDFNYLISHADPQRKYTPLARFPAIRRDLSLIVDEDIAWKQLVDAINSTGQEELESVEYVGTYRGKQIPKGKKSITLSLTYRSSEGTLRHERVDGMVKQVVDTLGKTLQVRLRT